MDYGIIPAADFSMSSILKSAVTETVTPLNLSVRVLKSDSLNECMTSLACRDNVKVIMDSELTVFHMSKLENSRHAMTISAGQ